MESNRRRSRAEIDNLRGSDSELLQKAKEGDDAAFHELVDRYASSMFRLAFALVGNGADAEDVVQETFVGAFQRMASFRGKSSVKTWLLRILSKQAARCHRRRSRNRAVPAGELLNGSQVLRDRIGGGQADETTDVRLDMTEIIGKLSMKHGQVLVLRELEGMSYSEIAEALGVPRGTVESRLFRARQELKKQLAGYLP